MNLNNYYIPQNIDLDQLVLKLPEAKKSDRDRLGYIISNLTYKNIQKMYKDSAMNHSMYINSSFFQSITHDYKKYLDVLEAERILLVDHEYSIGVKSKGYRFFPEYISILKSEDFVDGNFHRRMDRKREKELKEKNRGKKPIKYLEKWLLHPGLSVDIEGAQQKIQEMAFLDDKDTIINAQNTLINLDKIRHKNFKPLRDKVSGRYHSPITNLSKEYKQFIRFNEQELVQIDIKNCQPYLLQVLFDENAFKKLLPKLEYFNRQYELNVAKLKTDKKISRETNEEIGEMRKDGEIGRYPVSQTGEIGTLGINSLFHYMSEKNAGGPMNTGGLSCKKKNPFGGYLALVNDGKFYEEMARIFTENSGKYHSREDAKKTMYQVLFSDNRWINNNPEYKKYDASLKKLFSECFPEVYEIVKEVKRSRLTRFGKTMAHKKADFIELQKSGQRQAYKLAENRKIKSALAMLLQNIESYIMLDCVCKRITKEHPHIPLFTIHDCIATTEEHIPQILKILTEEFEKHIGVKPPCAIENWG